MPTVASGPVSKSFPWVSSGKAFLLAGTVFLAGCQVSPVALTNTQLVNYADDKLARITANQEPISGQVSLYQAMARALKYNLDYRVEIMNRQLANKNLRLRSASMLPEVVANGGFVGRDNSAASYSKTLLAGVRSVDPSYSQEKTSFAGDVTFSWHILDFGLSYVRAQQAADQALIAEEQKRKIINKIIEDVRVAYWRAVSSDRLLSGFQNLRKRTERALRNSRRLLKSGQASPVASLSFQRELVDIKRQIHRLERELRTSKMQLAALMNVNPGSNFSLLVPKRRVTDLAITSDANQMVSLALQNRPELREVAYETRINEKEAKAAVLEILPGATLYAGTNLDSNDFLYNSNWIGYGARVGWNLMKVFQYPAMKGSVEAKDELLDQRALATSMAIITQVYVSRARYKYLSRSAHTAAEYYSVQRRLLAQVRASVNAGVASEQTLIREEMNTLVAAVQYDVAYADLQNAFASVYASVGFDPYDQNINTNMSVNELSKLLKDTWRMRGDSHI